jgi:hypothetical protein
MTISLKHAFTNPKSDGGDDTIVRPSNWNAEHTLTCATARMLGRTTAGEGAVEELDAAAVRTFADVEQAGVFAGLETKTASHTLVLTDKGKVIEMNVAGANNLTVPLNSSVAFPLNTQITIIQYGAGQTTIVPAGGVTIRSLGGALKTVGQYSAVSLFKRGTDEWIAFGSLTT